MPMDLSLQMDCIDADKLTTGYFRENYLFKSKPLIINGYTNLFPAGKTWSFNYLKENTKNCKVGIYDYKTEVTKDTKPDFFMELSDYLNIIQQNRETSLKIPNFDFFKRFVKQKKEFPPPLFLKGLIECAGSALFNGKNTSSPFSFEADSSNILLTQLIGRSRVILVSPDYNKLLYKVPFSNNSLVDPEKPDLKQYPGLKYVKAYNVILQPGDAIYIPGLFWHYSKYLEGSVTVMYKSVAHTLINALNGLMNAAVQKITNRAMNLILKTKWETMKKELTFLKANAEISKAEIPVFGYKTWKLEYEQKFRIKETQM